VIFANQAYLEALKINLINEIVRIRIEILLKIAKVILSVCVLRYVTDCDRATKTREREEGESEKE